MNWQEFCSQLNELGADIDRSGDQAGLRHLTNQVACWLTFALGADVNHPTLFRSSDPVYQWGGPNADQVARRAPITGEGTYRLSGTMGTCEQFIVQIKLGAVQSGGATIAEEVNSLALGIGPGEDFVLTISATDPGDGSHWIELDPAASFLHIRDYYFRWEAAPPATFVLERLDTQGLPSQPADPSAVLEMALTELRNSAAFWNTYQAKMLGDQAVNTFLTPRAEARGVKEIFYAHAGVALADDHALVVELDHAGAPMWDVQLYTRPWYEALDYANHTSCTNHALAGEGPIVISRRDPGGANWLDTQGQAEVLAPGRWWRPTGQPEVRSRVVPVDSLDLPAVDRRAQVAQRSAHVSWRYRT